jgi:hypothetical protein
VAAIPLQRKLCQPDLDGQQLSASTDRELHLLASRTPGHEASQLVPEANRCAVQRGDQVARSEAREGTRALARDLRNRSAPRRTARLRPTPRGNGPSLDSEPSPADPAARLELRKDRLDEVDRDRQADLRPIALVAKADVVDADDLSPRIDKRSPGAPGMGGRVGLVSDALESGGGRARRRSRGGDGGPRRGTKERPIGPPTFGLGLVLLVVLILALTGWL